MAFSEIIGNKSALSILQNSLDAVPKEGLAYREFKIRREIEDKFFEAFKENGEKFPFSVVVDDSLAEDVKRIVNEVRWLRRGGDIEEFLDAMNEPEDVEVDKDDKVIPKDDKKKKK